MSASRLPILYAEEILLDRAFQAECKENVLMRELLQRGDI
jgi:hypothetical protein